MRFVRNRNAMHIVNDQYKCVKPACTTDSDCNPGNKCENAGLYNAQCVKCDAGETCNCTGGMVADGNGGCKVGCEFSDSASCVGGTANCSLCTQTAGCYNCSSCKTGYELDGSTCVSCKTKYGDKCETCGNGGCTKCSTGYKPDPYTGKCVADNCPSGTSTSPSCNAAYEAVNTSYYSGDSICKKCQPCSTGKKCGCPDGYSSDGNGNCVSNDPCANVTCSGGKVCDAGVCGCPSDKPNWDGSQCRVCTQDSHCASTQKCDKSSYTCVAVTCANTTCYTVQNHVCVKTDGCCTSDSECTGTNQKCDPSSNTCVGKSCSEINSSYKTSCGSHEVPTDTGVTANGSKCYTCDTCEQWYTRKNGSCQPSNCPPNTGTNKTCSAGQKVENTTAYSGSSVCQFCTNCNAGEKCNCPGNQVANGRGGCANADPCENVTCSGGKVCSAGSCVCPSSKPHWDGSKCQPCTQDSHCGTNKYCYDNGSGSRSCDDDCSKLCPEGYRNGGLQVNGTCAGRPCRGCVASGCPSGYCLSNGKCIKEVSCNVERCSECVCGSETLCKRCNRGWTGPMMNGLSGVRGYGSCDCKNSGYVAGKWVPGACY